MYKAGAQCTEGNVLHQTYPLEYPQSTQSDGWPCPLFDILLDKYFPAG